MVLTAVKVLMPTSQVMQSKKKSILKNRDGFSLIEILISLFLISLIFFSIPSSYTNSETQLLGTTVDDFQRAIRFSSQEAILRNSIVRLKIDLDKTPQEYSVEYGPKDAFVLPEFTDDTSQSLADEETNKKKNTDLDSKFAKVPEFEDTSRPLDENIRILGVATSYRNALLKTSVANIYFYPSGERDSAIIILSSSVEMAALDIEPYSDKINTMFKAMDLGTSNEDPEDFKLKLAETTYKDWLTNDQNNKK